MSRLGQNETSEPKQVVTMGPSSEELQERIQMSEFNQGSIKTAASYSERVQDRKDHIKSVKKKTVLGGAPPLDPQKMGRLVESLLPKPDFLAGAPKASEEITKPPREGEQPEISGVGAAYHINQEIARGKIGKPVSMKEAREMANETREQDAPKKSLSEGTLQALHKVKEATEEAPEEKLEREQTPPLAEDTTSNDLKGAAEEIVNEGRSFDFGAIREAQTALVSKARKKTIEGRLGELDIADLITKREIQQVIPIVPDKLTYTLRTFNQQENLFCLQYMYDHPGSAIYYEEFLNTCKLVCALVAINGAQLPDHRKNPGTSKEEVTKELFERKMSVVTGLPTQMIADISINTIWFNERVTNLFGIDNLKNG